jgi:hypothetical protein
MMGMLTVPWGKSENIDKTVQPENSKVTRADSYRQLVPRFFQPDLLPVALNTLPHFQKHILLHHKPNYFVSVAFCQKRPHPHPKGIPLRI